LDFGHQTRDQLVLTQLVRRLLLLLSRECLRHPRFCIFRTGPPDCPCLFLS
jgi:hypothetical protein